MKRLRTLQGHVESGDMERLRTQGFALFPHSSGLEGYWEMWDSAQVTLQPIDVDRIAESLHSFSPGKSLQRDCFLAFRAEKDWELYLVPGSQLLPNVHFPRSAAVRVSILANWTVVLSPRLKHCPQVASRTPATRFLIRLHS